MRKMGIVLSSFIIGLVTVGLVTGQQEQQQPKKKITSRYLKRPTINKIWSGSLSMATARPSTNPSTGSSFTPDFG